MKASRYASRDIFVLMRPTCCDASVVDDYQPEFRVHRNRLSQSHLRSPTAVSVRVPVITEAGGYAAVRFAIETKVGGYLALVAGCSIK